MHATSSTYTSPDTPTCEVPSNGRAVYRIFAEGGRTWSMSKRGGARLFVAAGQPQGGGCRRQGSPQKNKVERHDAREVG